MAASLTRSTISFRRQGSSGIVWGDGSIPRKVDGSERSLFANPANVGEEHRSSSSSTPATLFHSRSTGSVETPRYFRSSKSEDRMKAHNASHKHSFLKWVKRILSKSG